MFQLVGLFFHWCKLIFGFFSALTHKYGRDGRDEKKFEKKCLLFDFEFFQKVSEKSFIDQYSITLDTFASALDKEVKSGKTINYF